MGSGGPWCHPCRILSWVSFHVTPLKGQALLNLKRLEVSSWQSGAKRPENSFSLAPWCFLKVQTHCLYFKTRMSDMNIVRSVTPGESPPQPHPAGSCGGNTPVLDIVLPPGTRAGFPPLRLSHWGQASARGRDSQALLASGHPGQVAPGAQGGPQKRVGDSSPLVGTGCGIGAQHWKRGSGSGRSTSGVHSSVRPSFRPFIHPFILPSILVSIGPSALHPFLHPSSHLFAHSFVNIV